MWTTEGVEPPHGREAKPDTGSSSVRRQNTAMLVNDHHILIVGKAKGVPDEF
ncbi:MAG: hypothetical protein ACI8XM_002315 [Haloarculaceae archaeon]|jgi:hypothetical protein